MSIAKTHHNGELVIAVVLHHNCDQNCNAVTAIMLGHKHMTSCAQRNVYMKIAALDVAVFIVICSGTPGDEAAVVLHDRLDDEQQQAARVAGLAADTHRQSLASGKLEAWPITTVVHWEVCARAECKEAVLGAP